tara:strand:- start:286 stop:3105 length:2820 start_codon:yes stop_codon:yes gene_type:complete
VFEKLMNKTFGLRDGEIHISFLMQLYIFIIITILLIVKPTVNALFLSQLGADHLPYGYILVAIIAVVTSYFYTKAIRRFSLIKVIVVTLVLFSLSFVLLSYLLYQSLLNDWMLYIYYLGVSLFAVITTSQFWILANMVYNTREAKRLFGFIGAGAIAGGIFGGYLTSIVTEQFGNMTVILIAAFLTLCCIPLLIRIYKLKIKKLNVYVRSQRKFNDTNESQSSLSLISKSKHLTYLALIAGIGVIVAKLVDFQFSDFASRAIENPDKLASFFGFWFSSFNLVALILQLFLTNRLLSKLGVSSTLLILPLGIALGSLLFLTFPELWVLIIIKGIDGGFKQSLNKAAYELSIMPIPLNVKNQAKSYIDVVVDSIATGLSGLMLIFLIRKLDLSTSYITVIVLFFVFIWMLLIYRLREAYFNSFRTNIQKTLSKENITDNKNTKVTSLSASRRVLDGDDEQGILNLLDRLSTYKIKALKGSIINLLDFPSNKVKIEAIRQFYLYDKGTALPKVEALINEKDDNLVFEALYYIIEHSSTKEEDFFTKYLDHPNDYIANAALLCLAKIASDNEYLALKYNLDYRVGNTITSFSNSQEPVRKEAIAMALVTIAHSDLKKYYSFIETHLSNSDSYIVSYAIKAAGITKSLEFIEPILEFLDQKFYRKRAIKALRKYGPEITKMFLKFEANEVLKDNSKRFIPKVIESFKTQNSVKVLMRLMKSRDVVIRLEASHSLNKLKHRNEKLYFNTRALKKLVIRESKYYKNTLIAISSLNEVEKRETEDGIIEAVANSRQKIIDILEDQLYASLKCTFELLSLLYDATDIQVSYSGILSDSIETRVNAIEFLDNLLQNQMKRRVLPLLEHTIMADTKQQTVLPLKQFSESASLSLLIRTRGKRIKLEILTLVKELGNPKYTTIIEPLKRNKNEEVRKLAFQIINDLKRQSA